MERSVLSLKATQIIIRVDSVCLGALCRNAQQPMIPLMQQEMPLVMTLHRSLPEELVCSLRGWKAAQSTSS
jgi:hypothetical protein